MYPMSAAPSPWRRKFLLTEQRINLLLPMIPEGLLADETQYVQGTLIRDDNTVYICDSDNLEILLRMQRAAGRVSFDTLSHKRLPGFLQAWRCLR